MNANPLSRIWNAVLTNFFFQIAAKINVFAVTATGEKTAIRIEVAIDDVIVVVIVELCVGEGVVLKDMTQP